MSHAKLDNEVKAFKRKLKGVVVSNKSDKTVVVKVERKYMHPLYSKFIKSSKKFHAHDPMNKANEGDLVTIIESRPMSKLKRWTLLEINSR